MPGVGIGMLSWKAHGILRATLETYRAAGLFGMVNDAMVFFNEIGDDDRAIAEEFGLRAEGNEKNLGVRDGMKAVAERLATDYVLYLENDMPLVKSGEEARRQIQQAADNLRSGAVNYYTLKYTLPATRDNLGVLQKYLPYHPAPQLGVADSVSRKLRRLLRPGKAEKLIGAAIFADSEPHRLFPGHIAPLPGGHWAVDSSAANWSNWAAMYPRRWFLDEIVPYAEAHPTSRPPDIEKPLNRRWWRRQHYRLGFCAQHGLFEHGHATFPADGEKAQPSRK